MTLLEQGPDVRSRGPARDDRRAFPRTAPLWRVLESTRGLVVLSVAAAVARTPFLGSPLSPDEAGFTLVGRQWAPGPSLYGKYWVDRPPLLIELFRVAAHVGAPFGLRLLGCLAVALATLFVGLTARRIAGPRAALWASSVAAISFSSHDLGALQVNGELLAAPFIAGSIYCWLEASVRAGRSRIVFAVCAGAAAASAVLVKQNMIDAVVFFAVVAALGTAYGPSRKLVASSASAWLAGAGGAVLAVMTLAVARGSTAGGVWFAMYPFRLVAADPINGASTQQHLAALGQLGGLELATLGPIALLILAILVLRRRRALGRDLTIIAAAVAVVAAYDVFSISAGGSYWTHYLVQLVVPTALAVGIVADRVPKLGGRVAITVVAASLVVWSMGITHTPRYKGQPIGVAIARVSEPGDTIISALGDADVVAASGLGSDYPFLWSLPARSLDRNFRVMASQLGGPTPPTWVVVRGPATRKLLLSKASGTALRERYHVVGEICGRTIYLRNSAQRQPPVSPSRC